MDNNEKKLTEKELSEVSGGSCPAELQKFIVGVYAKRHGLSLGAGIEELAPDSLDTVDIVKSVEDEFKVSVPKEDFSRLTSFPAMAEYFSKLIR